jgi:hypothetical protein
MGVGYVGICGEGVLALGALGVLSLGTLGMPSSGTLGVPSLGLYLAVGTCVGACWASWLATTTTKPGELGMSAWTCRSLGLGLVSALLLRRCRACRI